MDLRLDKFGLDLFALPLHWTHVVKKKSSWSSSSHRTPTSTSAASTSSNEDDSTKRSRNRRDDYNSLESKDYHNLHNHHRRHHPHEKLMKPAGFSNSSSYTSSIARESPSFGKSREFRSFGSNRSNPSLDSMASFYSLKPTYMTPRESKQLDDESCRYNYIIPNPSSEQASTTSSNPNVKTAIRVISALSPDTDRIDFDDQNLEQELETTTITYSSLAK
jgi:hypothetical protein